MNLKRSIGVMKLLAVLAVLVALAPASASACDSLVGPVGGALNGTALEVQESAPQHAAPGGPAMPGAFSPGIGDQLGGVVARIAQATEDGSAAGCGSLQALTGDVVFHAQSRIPFDAAGLPQPGVISGNFHLEAVSGGKVNGTISGDIAFVLDPMCGGACPLATVSGEWSTKGKSSTGGGFLGVAYVPIPLGCTEGCVYLDPLGLLSPDKQLLVPLQPEEYDHQFGTGMAKFVFSLFQ